MAIEFGMPQLGESVVEGTIGKWLKQPGDVVQEFEPLLEVITDKVDTEVPSPASGVILEVRAAEGDTVKVGEIIAVIGEAGAGMPAPSVAGPGAPALDAVPARAETPQPSPQPKAAVMAKQPGERPMGRRYYTPVVARIAAAHDVDLSLVPGTGRSGRITKKDIQHYLEERKKAPPVEKTATAAPGPDSPPAPAKAPPPAAPPAGLESGDVEVPLSKMRLSIVHHMRRAKDTAAHVTTFMEVDLSRVAAFRNAHKTAYASEGLRLTYTAFFMEAIVAGLKAFPMLNAVLAGDTMIYRKAVNIGMAVDLGEDGLIVPVVKGADDKSLRGLARAIDDLAGRARSHTLSPDDVQAATFTLTNHGTIGSLAGTPIIPMPQVAILGVGAIQKRPVVVEAETGDMIAIRPMAYLSLSFDHRAIDGATADRFLGTVKAHLEGYGGSE
jgi:2-oxoglutarate dehydrogenase E2 component (dihydrolipoamide succinyltransferase)